MDEQSIRQRMQSALDAVRQDAGSIRTGRATPALVENIIVNAYGGPPAGGQKLRVMELATITAPDPQSIVVSPWDKSIIGDIKKGIEQANIGLTPVLAGEVIRINIPPLTSEDRENYIKILHQKLENGRIAVRQIRQEGMHEVRDAFEKKEISEDQKVLREKNLQEITDEYIRKIEEAGEMKEKELRSL
ncbi:MAG: ribosome recycling factor [Candidatus Blackburnbacteria bacterium]|nr:ribosome recycling factor [Candidatus Blackburnbacteria bacterium]